MNPLLRKTFSKAALGALMVLTFAACSSHPKTYCSFVVENEAPESQDNTDKANAEAEAKKKPKKKASKK